MKKCLPLMGVLFCSLFSLPANAHSDDVIKQEEKTDRSPVYDIRDFGARGDSTSLNTKAIQSAIDKCNADGGGAVLIAGGKFVTGTLYIKSNICLRIEAGSVLLGSSKIADYATNTDRNMYKGEPYMDRCLIFARDAENIAIEGNGMIDGRGKSLPEKGDSMKNRPKMIRMIGCSHLRLRDITLKSPASWTTEFRNCTDIAVDGLTIASRNISNGDGLDFDGCTHVRVANSTFNTGDDAICLQTSSNDHPCMDITVTNCNFSSRWAGIRIGLLSRSNFENVVVSNCTFSDHNDSGIKIQLMEGSEMKNMLFSNLVMKNVPRAVFLTFNRQNAWVDASGEPAPMKRLYNLVFSNIIIENPLGTTPPIVVTGLADHPIENLVFNNITATLAGGGTTEDAKNVLAELTVENLKGRWPEYGGLKGVAPAYGMYIRHVNGISIQNFNVRTNAADARQAIVFVDVEGGKTSGAPEPAIQ
ncbi:MAG: glycosyl hydrolase family 28 protein [Ferruginibacter sp.]